MIRMLQIDILVLLHVWARVARKHLESLRFGNCRLIKKPDGSDWELGSGAFGRVVKGLRGGVQVGGDLQELRLLGDYWDSVLSREQVLCVVR